MKSMVIFVVLLILFSNVYAAEDVEIPETFETGEKAVSDETTYFYAGSKLLASKDSSGVKYHYQDRLGSDVDSKSLPFGQSLKVGERFSFTGKELDEDLYYFNARYYDSSLGRFTSVDPVRDNLPYAYVSNDPINRVDPTGMEDVPERLGNVDPDTPLYRGDFYYQGGPLRSRSTKIPSDHVENFFEYLAKHLTGWDESYMISVTPDKNVAEFYAKGMNLDNPVETNIQITSPSNLRHGVLLDEDQIVRLLMEARDATDDLETRVHYDELIDWVKGDNEWVAIPDAQGRLVFEVEDDFLVDSRGVVPGDVSPWRKTLKVAPYLGWGIVAWNLFVDRDVKSAAQEAVEEIVGLPADVYNLGMAHGKYLGTLDEKDQQRFLESMTGKQ